MKADFEAAIEEMKVAFSEFKEVLVVILYGSVARGDFSRRHSDLDLFVLLNKKKADDKLKNKINLQISSICLKHAVRAHIEFQGMQVTSEEQSLIRKMIEEGRVIYSSGIIFFDNLKLGLKQYILYSFSTKNSPQSTLFSKSLHGKKSWYYKGKEKVVKKYPGIIDNSIVLSIGKGGLLVLKDKQATIEEMFSKFKVDYKIKKIVYG